MQQKENCRMSEVTQRCSVKWVFLKFFAIFTGKHLCQILFFNKVTGLRPKPITSLTKRLWYRCFPMDFAKCLRAPVFKEHLRWLLLNKVSPVKMKVRHCNHNPFMSKLLRKAIMERSDWKYIQQKENCRKSEVTQRCSIKYEFLKFFCKIHRKALVPDSPFQ